MCDGPKCCPPPGGRLQGIIRPWLLLLLKEKDAHGYELLEKLKHNENICGIDPGFLYRTLRQFEEGGIVRSRWDEEGQGPARRVYTITDEGISYLHEWADHVRTTRERLGRFLTAYETYFNPGGENE